jgi:dTDP-glucose 4,6-dehydratase
VISHAVQGKAIPVYGDGQNVRDWIHVYDHNRAIDTVFHKAKAGDVFNIGGRNEQTNIDIVKNLLTTISQKTGRNREALLELITFVKDRPGHDRRYAIDPSKIEKILGWKPEKEFAGGLSETVDWYLANTEWWQRIISGDYREYFRTQYGGRLE